MTIADLKKEYLKQLNIVKDDKNGKSVRVEACNKMKNLYADIKSEEPKVDIVTPEQVFDKYVQKLEQKDVVWYDTSKEVITEAHVKEIQSLEEIRKLAYVWVRMNHPNLDDQSDKFGQIVNARMQLIIANRQ